jgi:hypothetical protein
MPSVEIYPPGHSRRWRLPTGAVILVAALGGCGTAATTGTMNATDGGVSNPAIIKVADPVAGQTKDQGQGGGGFGGAKKPATEPANLMPQIGPKVAARNPNDANGR